MQLPKYRKTIPMKKSVFRPVTLREEHKLRVFENRVLRKMFGPRRDKATGVGEDYITRSIMLCTPQ
jgi:hypothetical protein